MKSYWVTFKDRGAGCVEAEDETAAMVAARLETGREPIKAEILPYPADPRIVLHKYQNDGYNDGKPYHCPSFCYTPKECKGKVSCRKRPACTE